MAHLLLVDDSEAILAFERSVLSAHHTLATARNGAEALQRTAEATFDAVLLDLSMPVMTGDEALRRMKADVRLRELPVLVISSETARRAECLALGAEGFLPKPLRADTLHAEVERLLERTRRRVRARSLQILPLRVGDVSFAVGLSGVRHILDQVRTRPLPSGPAYLGELLELPGQAVPVLDVAARLGVANTSALLDRKLVVIGDGAATLALCVDAVEDPEEIPPERVTPGEALGTAGSAVAGSVLAVARRDAGALAVLDPAALVPRGITRELAAWTRTLAGGEAS